MHRRNFLLLAGAGAAVGAAAGIGSPPQVAPPARQPAPPRKALMKVGTQHVSADPTLRGLAALGVNHICSDLPSPRLDDRWSVDGLLKLRERVESPNILLGKSPERDREIDAICQMIRNAAKAGIPAVKYNLSILGVVRTEPTPGRGGASYSTFVYDRAKQEPPLTAAGPVNADLYWERISYFLKRVVPVAEECKVRLACHPHDPGMPADKGYRGVHTVLGSVEGLKRFVETVPSPYHGLNFCQGTVAEMLQKPAEEIFDVIRYFGTRGKIFNVHFRNIKGGFLNFQESFLDDGDVDMLRAMRVYKEVGYDGMIMPDHVPRMPGDPGKDHGFAFAYGYIKALIAVVNAEA